MGYLSALGIKDTDTTTEQQVAWHFQSNCYPPVPGLMIPFAVKAINLANRGDWNTLVDCPSGVSWRGNDQVAVHTIIEQLHLEAWVEDDDAY